MGCQPNNNRKNRKIGRTARGQVAYVNGIPSPLSSNRAGTKWGEVTGLSGDQAFRDELYYFTAPMMQGASAEDQLGYVSSQSAQRTGVAFWGEASIRGSGGMGQLEGSTARLHIEIYDDKYGQKRPDGSTIEQVSIHIGYDQEGFVGAQGTVQNGQANLTFTDSYGSIVLQGQVVGQTFAGTMYYSNDTTSGQMRALGRFSVEACGFFICQ
ncbi:MAG: hypothetical protein HC902_13020 [Calothrix sp. SM1_5_4]|nr:hypothetical protein [Calothrix sp. SM1_5_4]